MDIRPSPIAGQWYPGEAGPLAETVDAYVDAAQIERPAGAVVALIAPHAGHLYSGPVAGYAFAAVRGQTFDTVAILSPSHFHADGPLVTSAHAAYQTPLGTVPVDHAALAALRADLQAQFNLPGEQLLPAIRRDREHAVEIELPFLQRVLSGAFQLVPVMVRDQSERVMRGLAQALTKILTGRRALVVGSSDLSHFYSGTEANKLDAEMLKQIDAFDPEGVLQTEEAGRGYACGHGPIAAALWAARGLGANHARVLRHATSGDVTGEFAEVVGYGAAVVWKE
jgi:hypothetical protein